MRPFRERRVKFVHDLPPVPDDFHLPSFNLDIGIWHNLPADTPIPPTAPRSARDVGQLVSDQNLLSVNALVDQRTVSCLRVPSGSPVLGVVPPGNTNDVLEVPLSSGRFYSVLSGEFMHLGFRNSYYMVSMVRLANTNGPINP
jgi:hypothetical protein